MSHIAEVGSLPQLCTITSPLSSHAPRTTGGRTWGSEEKIAHQAVASSDVFRGTRTNATAKP